MEASDYRRIARENLTTNWWLSIGVAALAWLLGGMMLGSSFLPKFEIELNNIDLETLFSHSWNLQDGGIYTVSFGFPTIFALARFIIGGVIQLGYAHYLLKQCDHRNFEFNDLFSEFDRFGAGFCQAFLRSMYTFLWSLLFIIPGIVKSYAYAMTPFILAEHPDMTANEAITASRQMMDGHKGELFWLHLTFIGWDLLCILTLNLGHLALNPYKNAAEAAFYRDISRHHVSN